MSVLVGLDNCSEQNKDQIDNFGHEIEIKYCVICAAYYWFSLCIRIKNINKHFFNVIQI